jgi:hypothetical protein
MCCMCTAPSTSMAKPAATAKCTTESNKQQQQQRQFAARQRFVRAGGAGSTAAVNTAENGITAC